MPHWLSLGCLLHVALHVFNAALRVLHVALHGRQAATGQDGKPMLGRFSSKVGGLLDELADVLGAFEGIPTAQEGQQRHVCSKFSVPSAWPVPSYQVHESGCLRANSSVFSWRFTAD